MQQRILEFWPTVMGMSFNSQACLVLGAIIITCAVYLMRTPFFEEGLGGRVALLIATSMTAVLPIEIYVNAGVATFEFATSTVSLINGFAVIMIWLASRAWLAGRQAKTCIARWPFVHER